MQPPLFLAIITRTSRCVPQVLGVHRTYERFHASADIPFFAFRGLSIPSLFFLARRVTIGWPFRAPLPLPPAMPRRILFPRAAHAESGLGAWGGRAGLVIVFLVKTTLDMTVRLVWPPLAALLRIPLRSTKPQRSGKAGANGGYDPDTLRRFVSYAGTGWAVTELTMYCFEWLGI